MSSLRIPMFLKFLVGCITLAALLIVGGTFVVQRQAQQASQGNFLAKHLRRYQGYEERAGRGLTTVLEVLADDPRLRRALAKGQASPTVGPEAPDAISPATLGESLFAKLTAKNGLQPDFLILFDAKQNLVWASQGAPIKADDLGDMAAIDRVREGGAFAHKLVLLQGLPYQVSAEPVRSGAEGDVVGGILAGVRLQRYYEEFADQSDDVAENRTYPTLLRGTDVLASAYAEKDWPAVSKALQLEKLARVTAYGEEREVVHFGNTLLYFYSEDLVGYRGGEYTTLGKIFLTRNQTADASNKIPWLEIGIGVGLSIVVALAMAYWITRPIKQFVAQSRNLHGGETDLTQRIVVRSRDETADLAENINQVFVRLHGLASGVQTAAFQVGASSAEISAASKQMLGGIKDQSGKIESSTAAVTELSASIQQVAENAALATEVASKSNIAVTSAVQRMEQIRAAVDDAAEKIRELGESSKRIGNIVEVIRQISEQTSLLALNAAIQAAQAGEQGRGFAVVADEVSSLARRAGQSAKDIEALIQTVKEQTTVAVASMEKGTGEVDSGTQLVSATLGDLGKLTGIVHDTAQAVQEQALVSDEIARNMDAVQRIASEVLTGAEESVLQAERLHELAFELEHSIGGFNLDGAHKEKPRHSEPPPPRPVASSPSSPRRSLGPGKGPPRALGKGISSPKG